MVEEEGRFPYRFFVVTFAWSWLIWLPLVLAGAGIIPLGTHLLSAVTVPVTILGIFGPAVGAFYCLRAARRQGRRSPVPARPAGSSFWLVCVACAPAGAWRNRLACVGTAGAMGRAAPEDAPAFRMGPPTVLTGDDLPRRRTGRTGLRRGYILDPLEERLGPWLGSLVLGVIWAVWHAPLFFIPGKDQSFVPFAFVILLVGYSYFYAAMRQAAGKRTMAGLVTHGWANAVVPLFPTIVMAKGAAQQRYWIWASLTLLVGVLAMIVRLRKARSRLGSPDLVDGQQHDGSEHVKDMLPNKRVPADGESAKALTVNTSWRRIMTVATRRINSTGLVFGVLRPLQ